MPFCLVVLIFLINYISYEFSMYSTDSTAIPLLFSQISLLPLLKIGDFIEVFHSLGNCAPFMQSVSFLRCSLNVLFRFSWIQHDTYAGHFSFFWDWISCSISVVTSKGDEMVFISVVLFSSENSGLCSFSRRLKYFCRCCVVIVDIPFFSYIFYFKVLIMSIKSNINSWKLISMNNHVFQ